MFGSVTDPLHTNGQSSALSKDGGSGQLQGQPHDTISESHKEHKTVTMGEANEPEVAELHTEISAAQKMLSAVSGSLLTSLLGGYPPLA